MPRTIVFHRQPCRSLAAALFTLLAAFGTCALSGCASYTPAERDRFEVCAPVRLPADAWPERKTDELQSIVDGTPRTITRLVLDGSRPESEVPDELLDLVREPEGTVTYTGVHGVGIIRVIEPGRGLPSQDWRAEQYRAIRFISYSTAKDRLSDTRHDRWSRWLGRAMNGYLRRRAVSGVRPNNHSTLAMLYEGTRLRLVPPPVGVKPAGLIVHTCGLGSMEWEQPVLDELTRRGWYILRINTPRVWWYEADPFVISSEQDIPIVAKRLAGVIDDLVAEPAYAAEAALDYLAKQHPEIPRHPLVVLGCSAGALVAPAVAARIADKCDAAVLVGGGANLLRVSQDSDLTDGGIHIKWPDDNAYPSWRARLYREYLAASKLDPYHTARTMIDKPALLLLANLDSTVSADCGHLLWERMDRPERYNFTLGHRMLFWSLGRQSTRIADWCEQACAGRAAEPPAVAQHKPVGEPAAKQ